jgi:hypothetical protein
VTVSKLVKLGFNRVSGTISTIIPETYLKEMVDPLYASQSNFTSRRTRAISRTEAVCCIHLAMGNTSACVKRYPNLYEICNTIRYWPVVMSVCAVSAPSGSIQKGCWAGNSLSGPAGQLYIAGYGSGSPRYIADCLGAVDERKPVTGAFQADGSGPGIETRGQLSRMPILMTPRLFGSQFPG